MANSAIRGKAVALPENEKDAQSQNDMSKTEAKLRSLASRLGVRFEDDGGDITLVGDNQHTWVSTGTHDLFVEVGEFANREAALRALATDAELGRVATAKPH